MYLDYTNYDFSYLKEKGGVGFLDSWEFDNHNSYAMNIYKGALKRLDIYENLKKESLESFCALILPMSVDQIYLFRHKELLFDFLDKGGVIFNFAASICEYLPNLALYQQSPTPIRLREVKPSSHPIFKGVNAYNMNHRRGVKGFFNRGFLTPPKDAEILFSDSDDKCVGYIDRHSSKGVILSTAGADLFGYGSFEADTTRRMGLNCLLWLENLLQKKA